MIGDVPDAELPGKEDGYLDEVFVAKRDAVYQHLLNQATWRRGIGRKETNFLMLMGSNVRCTLFVGQLPARNKMGKLLTDFVLFPYPANISMQG